MANISFTIGEDLTISGPLNTDNCISVASTSYLGEGAYRHVYARDTICFHASSRARLREFAEKLLMAIPLAESIAESAGEYTDVRLTVKLARALKTPVLVKEAGQ